MRIVFKMAATKVFSFFFHSSGKKRSSIMFLHHKSVFPGLIQCDVLVLLWTFLLERLQFELRAINQGHQTASFGKYLFRGG